MNNDAILTFADHAGRFYAKQYGFPPVAGRLIGYLSVCNPVQQPIGDLADALLTSRSAIVSAVKLLENYKIVNRSRPAGSRSDLVSLNPIGWETSGFDPEEYRQLASLAREGLELLRNAPPERKAILEDVASLGDFLVERMPGLYEEWQVYRDKQHKSKHKK